MKQNNKGAHSRDMDSRVSEANTESSGEAAEKGAKKGKKGLRTALIAGGCVLLAVLLLAGGVLLFVRSKLNKIQYSDGSRESSPEEIAEPIPEEEELEIDTSGMEAVEDVEVPEGEAQGYEGIMNILLLGTDEREYEFRDNARSDATLVLSLNFDEGSAKLISLERGMGMKMFGGPYDGQVELLTHCFRWGGPEMMLREVQEYFKLDVDKYVRVNFTSFIRLIDLLGGVEIELTQREADWLNVLDDAHITKALSEDGEVITFSDNLQYDLKEGVNRLYGPAALGYARLRRTDSDWHRVVRQRKVIQAAIDGLKDADLKTLNNLVDEMLPMVQTNFTPAEIMKLMVKAPKFLGLTFDQMTIPVDRETMKSVARYNGKGAMAPNYELNTAVIHEFIYGEDAAYKVADLDPKILEESGYQPENPAA